MVLGVSTSTGLSREYGSMPRGSSSQSLRFQSAAMAERARLMRELRRLARRSEELAEELQELIAQRLEMESRLEVVNRAAGEGVPPGSTAVADTWEEPPNGVLSGSRIRTVAVRLLAATDAADEPIHYSEWYRLVEGAGFGVTGRDPLATFLTQVARSPVVKKAGRPGFYVLDLGSSELLHQQLVAIQRELSLLHQGQQTLDGVASQRRRRLDLLAELARTERSLEEAVEALGREPAAGIFDD